MKLKNGLAWRQTVGERGSVSRGRLPATQNFPSIAAPVASHRKVTDPCSAAHSYSVLLWHFQGILWGLEEGNNIQRFVVLGTEELSGSRGTAGVIQDVCDTE